MRIKKMRITRQVYEEIHRTIGSRPAETGGILGSSDGGRTINHFYFDESAHTTGGTYSPNTAVLNPIIADWNKNGIELAGVVHSHPAGNHTPSHGDYLYVKRIMDAMNVHGRFFMPIVNVDNPENSEMKIYPHIFEESKRGLYVRPLKLTVVDALAIAVEDTAVKDEWGRGRFERIQGFYPMEALEHKTVVSIGCGGTRQFIEDLARSGVGNFVLIDGDSVSATNIATQHVYGSEIGRNKAMALAKRIVEINPDVGIKVVPRFLDDKMSDADFETIVGYDLFLRPEDILICGCTDSFHAQARSAALAMKYGTPYLAGQLYKGGMAAEIYFSYPDVTTKSCPRCAMSSRYDAYERGYKNDVTSTGTPIFATTRVNAIKGQIALMLLLYHADEDCVYNDMLDQIAGRNFVMIQTSPFAKKELGITVFDMAVNAGSDLHFFDNTVFIPQKPGDGSDGHPVCPLCGGCGEVAALKGAIADTRTDWGEVVGI